jgi:protocatechuate 3,4-dioxygenase alpha subunit
MLSSSQTVGPFFGYALPYGEGPYVAPEWRHDSVMIRGQVLDGAGVPLPDALVEIWQPDGAGTVSRSVGALRRAGAHFSGFGRCPTDQAGGFFFSTVKPGSLNDGTAPYIALLVLARGLLRPIFTRIYFPGEEANATDPVLSQVDPARRDTLIARPDGERAYRFDVRLQGDQETVFFAF